MTLTIHTPAATPRQLKLISALIEERDHLAVTDGLVNETIMDSMIPDHFIARAEASAAITALLAAPKRVAAQAAAKGGVPLSN